MPPLPFSLIDPSAFAPAAVSRLSSLVGPSLLPAAASVGSLAMLEAVLSADNAVALAGIVQAVQPPQRRARLLNQGLLCAFVLRGLMIVAAAWVIRFAAVKVLGGLYLVWLALRHFELQFQEPGTAGAASTALPGGGAALLAVIACTDLAFSIDSISAAVAVSDNLALVLIGGALGVAMLRFLAGWVILWLDRCPDLAHAAYLSVLTVGLRMLARVLAPALDPPSGLVVLLMAVLFVWGFSRRSDAPPPLDQAEAPPLEELLLKEAASSGSGVCSTPVFTNANTARV
jgi:YkoY family integral membrane protein